jgi:hypothetical protein
MPRPTLFHHYATISLSFPRPAGYATAGLVASFYGIHRGFVVDDARFDGISKRVGRRGALAVIGGALLSLRAGRSALACVNDAGNCQTDADCCDGTCAHGQCWAPGDKIPQVIAEDISIEGQTWRYRCKRKDTKCSRWCYGQKGTSCQATCGGKPGTFFYRTQCRYVRASDGYTFCDTVFNSQNGWCNYNCVQC